MEPTHIKEIIIRVDWTDQKGTHLADATYLSDVPKTLEAIEKEKGTVKGIRPLECVR